MDRSWKRTRTPWESLDNMIATHHNFPVIKNIEIPLRTIFVLILIFAIAIGPVNFIVLARRNKRTWLFWTVPAFSLLTSVTVFMYSLLSEGITADIRMNALTILDQSTRRAVTLGLQGYYSPLTPRNGLRFDYNTEVTPLVNRGYSSGSARSVDWSRDQHFSSGWIESRIPAYFKIRKSELRRERLDLSVDGGKLQILNGLGVDIEQLWLADGDGNIHTAENIVAGKKVALTPTKRHVLDEPSCLRDIYASKSWKNKSKSLTASPEKKLRPGTYIVELKSCPFMENGLGRGDENFFSVVFGIL